VKPRKTENSATDSTLEYFSILNESSAFFMNILKQFLEEGELSIQKGKEKQRLMKIQHFSRTILIQNRYSRTLN
jgi:hypothetical protein